MGPSLLSGFGVAMLLRVPIGIALAAASFVALWFLTDVPLSADVREGDQLLTSGLGGRFPAGFVVGTVGPLRPDDSRAFLEADVAPAAQLDRGRDVLLLRGYMPVPAATPQAAPATAPVAVPAAPSATTPAGEPAP